MNSRSSRWHRVMSVANVARYSKKLKYGEWSRVCKFRIGEGMKEFEYWMNERKKKCRICVRTRERIAASVRNV